MPANPATPDALTGAEIVLDQIDNDDIDTYWPILEPLFAAACDAVSTAITPEIVRQNFKSKLWSAWAIYDWRAPVPLYAAAASSIRDTNRGRTTVIEALGGHDLARWMPTIISKFEQLAKANGIVRVEIEGRRGWERLMPDYKVERIVLAKVL